MMLKDSGHKKYFKLMKRYTHVDGKSYAQHCTIPRRERTIRDDYNVLNRGNRVELTKT